MSFDQLGLQAELLEAIKSEGYTQPTPIQSQAIPAILAGRDLLAGSQTGTGKTAAFALPILQLLQGRRSTERGPRALILTPTRELAAQVEESIRTYGANLPLRSTVVFGGVGFRPQMEQLKRGVDILVATPGRLLDHVTQRTVDLSKVEILILDEADRMLDMGFIHDIKRIMKQLPAKRQNLLFSATYSNDIKRLADELLENPECLEVARRSAAAEGVRQEVCHVPKSRKRELLSHMIKQGEWKQVLVFTRTKHGANRLAQQLAIDGITAAAIHGNKSQGARTKALAGFKQGEMRVLVATDIAARGLDIELLPHVVNYELPNVPEDYVHRIGRTGRAGESGCAVSLVSSDEKDLLRGVERLLRRPIDVLKFDDFQEDRVSVADQNYERPPRPQSNRSRSGAKAAQPRRRSPEAVGSSSGGGSRPSAATSHSRRRQQRW